MAVVGTHMLFYTPEPEAVRAALRDVFGWEHVEAHPGWLIFKLPPAELGVHPANAASHEICLMCDDLDATIDELRAKGVEIDGEPTDQGFGRLTTIVLPGDLRVLLYEPTHASPLEL